MFDSLTDPAKNCLDGDYIRDMLRFREWTPDGAIFDCKHFDGRNCTAYESRPRMCSGYPYGGACRVEGCTMTCRDSSR